MTIVKRNDATQPSTATQPRIAIVGVGGIFPGSLDVAAFWNHILNKSDLMTEVPAGSHWKLSDYYDADPKAPDKTYAKRGGFLPDVPFEPLKEGIPPNLLPSTDTSQLLALLVARTTLDEAFHRSSPLDAVTGGAFERASRAQKDRVSCLLGVTSGQELFGQMSARLRQPEWRAGMLAAGIDAQAVERAVKHIGDAMVPWTEASFPGLLGNVVAGRIANRLDLGGTNAVTDAACASSFAALSMAVDELVLNRADVVLCGGVDTLNDIFMHMCFSKTPALSASGECRPFDAAADGTLLGEGLGMVALKRLDDAERDGNAIYAVITGIGTASDGKSKSVYAPVPEGQAKAINRAYAAAGYAPSTVELVEAHGTGTKAGDAAELLGLRLAFDASGRTDRQWCALGSVKSQIGHTKAAAGAAGLLKAALALHEKILPPTLKVTTPNPAAQFDSSPFYVSSQARPWVRASGHPRRAGVSSFGFGGSNFHVALEEYTGPHAAKRMTRLPAVLVALNTRSAATAPSANLELWASDINAAFDPAAPFRACFVACTVDEANARLADLHAGRKHPQLFVGEGARAGSVCALFPGQGSQSVDMGAQLAMAFDAARAVWDRAADTSPNVVLAMSPVPAFTDDTRAMQHARLTQTEFAQPALGICSMATLAVLKELGVSFDVFGGHSVGELAALCAAGAFGLDTLFTLARARGEQMRDAAVGTSGTMAAVFAGAADVQPALAGLSAVVANDNAPDQVVISGETAAVDAALVRLAAAGIRSKRLDVSAAFHSPVVNAAAETFARTLSTVAMQAPARPVFANTTAAVHADVNSIKAALALQIKSQVRFVDQLRAMYAAGARVFVEVGPGSVLTGLVARTLKQPDVIAIATDGGAKGMLSALARLCAAGVSVDLKKLPRSQASRAPMASKTSVMLNGSNVGKPALPAPSMRLPAAAVVVAMAPLVTTREAPPPAALVSIAHTPQKAAMSQHIPPSVSSSWLDAFREGQRATADAHLAFQRTLTEAHSHYLQCAQNTQSALVSALTGSPAVPALAMSRAVVVAQPPLGSQPVEPYGAVPMRAPLTATPMNAPANGHVANGHVANGGATGVVHQRVERSVAPAQSAMSAVPLTTAASARALLLDVVAEKTGYPKDALDDSMTLEADLGIDSIKRVEILGALKDRLPAAGAMDAMQLAQLNTLGEIAAAIGGATVTPQDATPPSAAPVANRASAASFSATDVLGTLIDIVAQKTGYPKDALSASMALEGDLGVDSIKRVEILSALKDKLPSLPPLDAVRLAQLQTIGEIAGALDGSFL